MKYSILMAMLLMVSCSNLSDVEILDEKNDGDRKFLWVKIPERVSEDELYSMGKDFKSKYSSFDRQFVRIFVPNKDTIAFWATIRIEDDIEIDVLGTTVAENEVLMHPNLEGIDTAKIIGKWIDNTQMVSRSVIYFTKGDTLMMRSIYKDGGLRDQELTKKGSQFIVNEGEFNVIEDNGNLGIYGVNGKYYEYRTLD